MKMLLEKYITYCNVRLHGLQRINIQYQKKSILHKGLDLNIRGHISESKLKPALIT